MTSFARHRVVRARSHVDSRVVAHIISRVNRALFARRRCSFACVARAVRTRCHKQRVVTRYMRARLNRSLIVMHVS